LKTRVKQKQGQVQKRWTWLWDLAFRDYDNTPVILEEYSKALAQHCLFFIRTQEDEANRFCLQSES